MINLGANEIFIRFMRMPSSVRGLVKRLDVWEYCIILNEDLSQEALNKAMAHELRHIQDGDLDKMEDVEFIESKFF